MTKPRLGKVLGIVVARMGSTRIPGKSVLPLAGKPALWHVITNVKRAKAISQICLATSDLPSDDVLAEIARDLGVEVFRGFPEQVLDRVCGAVDRFGADVMIEIGGDCPFITGEILDDALATFAAGDYDYLCNYEPPTFPEGLDVNILKISALNAARKNALAPSQRVHPFSYLTRHRESYKIGNYAMEPDLSHYHWSLDFPEDKEFVQAVYQRLYRPGSAITVPDVLALIAKDPAVAALNERIVKPKVAHAFWNSPGIVRDMHTDVSALADMANQATSAGNPTLAAQCYDEISLILPELVKINEFKRAKK